MIRTVFVVFSATALLYAAYQIGKISGRIATKDATVVKYGEPYFVNQPYFGKCAEIIDKSERIEACATYN